MLKLKDKIYFRTMKFFVSGEKYTTDIAIRYARKLGVKVGEDCRFYETFFSSEPYLIEIGNHVTITKGVRFITHDGGVWVVRYLDNYDNNINLLGKIKIGDNVFIGVNSILMPGINIGKNTVIAAGSVVTKSFPDNVVIGGVPAKIIKSLDEYIRDNKDNYVNTKHLTSIQKRNYIMSINKNMKVK